MTLFSIYAYDQPLSRHREEASDPENPGERTIRRGASWPAMEKAVR